MKVLGLFFFGYIKNIINGYNAQKRSGTIDHGKCYPVVVLEHAYTGLLVVECAQCRKFIIDKFSDHLFGRGQDYFTYANIVDKAPVVVHYVNYVQCFGVLSVLANMRQRLFNREVGFNGYVFRCHQPTYAVFGISKKSGCHLPVFGSKQLHKTLCYLSGKFLQKSCAIVWLHIVEQIGYF